MKYIFINVAVVKQEYLLLQVKQCITSINTDTVVLTELRKPLSKSMADTQRTEKTSQQKHGRYSEN
jgi:hypothetical protein